MHPSDHVAPAPCSAWSQQAADLAAVLEREVAHWPDTPAHRLCAADGSLTPVGPGRLVPTDRVARQVDRALLIGCAVGEGLRGHHVIAGWSAHWVHTGARFPDPIELMTESHRSVLPGARVRHARLLPRDLEQIAGVPLTSPARTAADLLRFDGADAVHAVEMLVRTGLCETAQIREHLEAVKGYAGTRTAHGLLSRIQERCRSVPAGSDAVSTRERAVLAVREAGRWSPSRGRGAQALADSAPEPSTTVPSAVTR
jgi:hypothetical protein